MQIEQSLTLRLQGDDIGALRMLLSQLPMELRGGLPVQWPVGPSLVVADPDAAKRLVQRLMAAVSGGC